MSSHRYFSATRFMTRILLFGVLVAIARPASCTDDATKLAEHLVFFEKEVRPLIAERCYSCHSLGAKKVQAGLLVDSREALLKGGDSGEAVVPGDVAGSLLIEAVRYESYEMPPQGKLSDQEIQTLERWVQLGAPWPDEPSQPPSNSPAKFDLATRAQEHWVWQPIQSPVIPTVADNSWPASNIDRFILARLEQVGLHPAADADRSALVRRLYFDLIGLPPTALQLADCLQDLSPNATQRLVDRLLDSPQFGERWGRHWLDLVRYAESRGHEFDNDAPNAFQYRDYVIRALNADVPYDQFVREHIAGDLLTAPRLNPQAGFNESVLGTGFWFLGEWVHSPVDIRKEESDRFDNMIDVMSKTFLGLTVSCARCHDHKFDAISTADYYSLSGFLQSSDFRQVRFDAVENNRQIADLLEHLDSSFRSQVADAIHSSGLTLPEFEGPADDIKPFVVVDYGAIETADFLQDGFIFGQQPRRIGDAWLDTRQEQPGLAFANNTFAVSDPFWNGMESTSEKGVSNKDKLVTLPLSGRSLRTPTFTLTSGDVGCRVHGEGHVFACVDSHRLIAGPLHGETIEAIVPSKKWIMLDLNRYVGHQIHLEFVPAVDAQLEVYCVTLGAPLDVYQSIDQRLTSNSEKVSNYSHAVQAELAETMAQIVADWAQRRSQLRSNLVLRSRLAMAMVDGSSEDDHILIRGNSSQPGAVEPRHFLSAISGTELIHIERGSGRLELAHHINDPSNPLTHRVIVNRIWHYLLGRGIVSTTDDFGLLGQRPTHPELLDFLTHMFRTEGQSIKQLIRTIVLSRTYQMSSFPDEESVAKDPKNLLWHYRPPKRLEGEAIRDALLATSGELDTQQFGESVPVYLTEFMEGRGRPALSGPLDGGRRRSIYTAVRRNFLSPFMLTFDTPAPFSSMGRRNVSNVPAQALILMNDPFVVAQSRKWAQRTIAQIPSVEARVTDMFTCAFARSPTAVELGLAMEFVENQCASRGCDQNEIDVWSGLAHALINSKEFIFLR